MNRYRNSDNPFWSKIEFCKRHVGLATPKQQGFIYDMHRKGESYNMTEKQLRWLGSIDQALRKKVYS